MDTPTRERAMRRLAPGLAAAAMVAILCGTALASVDDALSDNARSAQWTLVEDDPATLWLDEVNNRLELRAANPTSASTDALYLSNGPSGFQIRTTSAFTLSVDYSYVQGSGGAIALALGIGRDLAGTDSAAIGFFRSPSLSMDSALIAAHRVADAETDDLVGFGNSTGTLTISYDPTKDLLALGDALRSKSLSGLVHGQLAADTVWVSFGGRGEGGTLGSGDATFTNFVASGDIVPTPEPATLALVALGGLGTILRRRPLCHN
jgi:hypothetical protein